MDYGNRLGRGVGVLAPPNVAPVTDPPGQKLPEVLRWEQESERAVGALHEALDALEQQLNPILSAAIAESAPVTAPEPCVSPLGGQLRDLANAIDHERCRVHGLLGRAAL